MDKVNLLPITKKNVDKLITDKELSRKLENVYGITFREVSTIQHLAEKIEKSFERENNRCSGDPNHPKMMKIRRYKNRKLNKQPKTHRRK